MTLNFAINAGGTKASFRTMCSAPGVHANRSSGGHGGVFPEISFGGTLDVETFNRLGYKPSLWMT